MQIPPYAAERSAMLNFRKSLPTYAMKKEILKAIRDHKVTMIVGGTGCGKTTQVVLKKKCFLCAKCLELVVMV